MATSSGTRTGSARRPPASTPRRAWSSSPAPGSAGPTSGSAAGQLPWPDRSFDLVTSFNALQFADDTPAALGELVRVAAPGGAVAIANWAEADRNDLNTIEDAVACAAGEQPLPDGDGRHPGGLEQLLRTGGLAPVSAGLVELPWHAADDDALVRGVLLGEDPAGMAAAAPTVVAAAARFRAPDGSYRLVNAFRYALGRTPG